MYHGTLYPAYIFQKCIPRYDCTRNIWSVRPFGARLTGPFLYDDLHIVRGTAVHTNRQNRDSLGIEIGSVLNSVSNVAPRAYSCNQHGAWDNFTQTVLENNSGEGLSRVRL